MEKVVALLWRRSHDTEATFADRLLSTTAAQLIQRGAQNLKVCVTDPDVSRGAALHIGSRRPEAMVSWWTDVSWDSGPMETALQESTSRYETYLVCESVPLGYAGPSGAGVRCEGFTTLSCIQPSSTLSLEDFRTRWFGSHCDVAIDTQSTHSYVRNEVVRPLTAGAPRWAGIVEEMFPTDALDDPSVFFDAVGDSQRLRTHQSAMFDSVSSFIDLETVESHPMSEYRF